jgi:hypothetical protein
MVLSVLMFTTVGSICLAMVENWLESCVGDGMVSGVASLAMFCNAAREVCVITVPINIPSANVDRTATDDSQFFAFLRVCRLLPVSGCTDGMVSLEMFLRLSSVPA